MEIDLVTEKSAKNTQRWWKLTATIGPILYIGWSGHFLNMKISYRNVYYIKGIDYCHDNNE